MKTTIKKQTLLVLCFSIIVFSATSVFALSKSAVDQSVKETGNYLYQTVKQPQPGSIGGEWVIFGLARSNYKVPASYYESYYKRVEAYVKQKKGKLHSKKYTEYSRMIIALTAIGKDPSNVAGYNLLTPLGDYEKTIWQGLNGPIWALLALDCGSYKMPVNKEAKVQATRQMYVSRILKSQLEDGGFSLTGKGSAEPDITAMALAALSRYQEQKEVKTAIDKGLTCLSQMQNNDGGYTYYKNENAESVAQVIIALTELGIPVDDSRFIKQGHTLTENLMSYYTAGKGFKHTLKDSQTNQMATEQGFYTLVALQRSMNKSTSLYRIHIKEGKQISE